MTANWNKSPHHFLKIVVLSLLELGILASVTNATHYRGGTAWFGPSQNYDGISNFDVLVEYYLGSRHSFESTNVCTEDTILEQVVNPGYFYWATEADSEIQPASFICIEYDTNGDFLIGYNQFTATPDENDQVNLWYQGRCWLQELYHVGCNWNMSLAIDFGKRSDIGFPNSSPKTGSLPIRRIRSGCPLTIPIPTTDPNGDRVTCRFAADAHECGEQCVQYPFFTLSEDPCALIYNGGGSPGFAAVTMIIEDHPHITITLGNRTITPDDVISAIPLQFIIEFYKLNTTESCNEKPIFVDDTPPDGQVITVVTGKAFDTQIFIEPSNKATRITEVTFIYPVGAIKSPLENVTESLFVMNTTWTPTTNQVGQHVFCFTALDDVGLSSDQRCLTIMVGGASSPCDIDNGGCSHACETRASSYICTCPHQCWELDEDGRTCKPDVVVSCESTEMTVSVPSCAVDDEVVTVGVVAEDRCTVNEVIPDYLLTYGFGECSDYQREDFWEISYYNNLRLYAHNTDENTPITRGAWYNIPIVCTFSKFGNLTSSFQPIDRQVNLIAVPGLGEFSFFLDYYNNASFENAIGPYAYPPQYIVNSDVYFAVRAVGGGGGTELFTVDCVASDQPIESETSREYFMISNGCLVDDTMESYESPSDMENHFSIKAFRFRDQLQNDDGEIIVFIRCSVLVCVKSQEDAITRCSQGCINDSRKRRSSEIPYRLRRQLQDDDDDGPTANPNVTQSPVSQVSSTGDIQIIIDIVIPPDPSVLPPGDGNDLQTTPVIVLVSAGVGGVLLLLIIAIAAIIVYHNRVIRPRNGIYPEAQPNGMSHNGPAYVRDIYLPSINLHGQTKSHFHAAPASEYVWAQRVIAMPRPQSQRLVELPDPTNGW